MFERADYIHLSIVFAEWIGLKLLPEGLNRSIPLIYENDLIWSIVFRIHLLNKLITVMEIFKMDKTLTKTSYYVYLFRTFISGILILNASYIMSSVLIPGKEFLFPGLISNNYKFLEYTVVWLLANSSTIRSLWKSLKSFYLSNTAINLAITVVKARSIASFMSKNWEYKSEDISIVLLLGVLFNIGGALVTNGLIGNLWNIPFPLLLSGFITSSIFIISKIGYLFETKECLWWIFEVYFFLFSWIDRSNKKVKENKTKKKSKGKQKKS